MNTILLLALMAAPGQDAPLHADPLVADRGQVRGGPQLSQRFTLTNRGQVPLTINEARPSCGCLNPALSTRALRPGEAATLDITVGTISQPDGANLWSVKMMYRVGETDLPLEVQLKANLVREVKLEPSAIRLVGAPGLSHEITLTDHREKPFEVIGVRASSPRLAVDAGAWQRDGTRWLRKVRVQLAADCPDGRSDETVTVYSTDPDYRELAVPVTVVRRDRQRYLVTPADVRLEMTPGRAPASVLLLIRDHDGRPVEIEKAECDDPAITCRFAEGAYPTATVRVGLAKDGLPRPASILTVRLRAPAAETMVVPVGVSLK
ncbi:MAG: DUF1573 domain-containing protein [Gemmataceae bacterium]